MSQETETVASLVRLALYARQLGDAARNAHKQYFQVALNTGDATARAAHVAAAGLDFGDTDAEVATVLTNLATLAENLAKLTNGGVVATSIDTSMDWLATMVEVTPAGLVVDQLKI